MGQKKLNFEEKKFNLDSIQLRSNRASPERSRPKTNFRESALLMQEWMCFDGSPSVQRKVARRKQIFEHKGLNLLVQDMDKQANLREVGR